MKLDPFFAQVKSLGGFGGLLAIIFYVLSLAVLVLQLMWYYDHPILYWVYIFAHLAIFVFGLYLIVNSSALTAFFIAIIIALLLGLMPYDLIFSELNRELSAPIESPKSSNGSLVLDVFFRPVMHLIILVLARFVLIRFLKL